MLIVNYTEQHQLPKDTTILTSSFLTTKNHAIRILFLINYDKCRFCLDSNAYILKKILHFFLPMCHDVLTISQSYPIAYIIYFHSSTPGNSFNQNMQNTKTAPFPTLPFLIQINVLFLPIF